MRVGHLLASSSDSRFAKPDELVTAKFEKGSSLSLPAAKALNLMIAQAAGDSWRDGSHIITRGELRAIGNMTNKEIEAILDELGAVRFKIETKSERGRQLMRRRPLFIILDNENSDQSDDRIEFEFEKSMRQILSKSDHYTVLYRKTMLAFDSKYALKLYEIGARQVRIGKALKLTVAELRNLMGVPEGKIVRWPDFRRYVLDSSFTEVNQVADFFGSWQVEMKRGRVIEKVSLAFAHKEPAAVEQAHREREATRVARRGRRKGAETVIQPMDSETDSL